MQKFRGELTAIGGRPVTACLDYAKGLDGLPKSDVLKFLLDGNCSVVVRPSGTEPKLKFYISVSAADETAAKSLESIITKELEKFLA
jgi:phosphoglucomutase